MSFQKATKISYVYESKIWEETDIEVSIESEPFAKGAMRNAYKMLLKLPDSAPSDWVAKNYFTKVEGDIEEAFKKDIILQCTAEHYSKLYNECPGIEKKCEIIPAHLMKTESEVYCIEPYIEGEYFKHNTNSGAILRKSGFHCTPHAFSHFTFEKSEHKLIVVDIQGVGEHYTDPQIHTCVKDLSENPEFGSGNLGIRGIALFLYTHQCNPICKALGLPEIPLFDDIDICGGDGNGISNSSVDHPFWHSTTGGRKGLEIKKKILLENKPIDKTPQPLHGLSESGVLVEETRDVLRMNDLTNSLRSSALFRASRKAPRKTRAALRDDNEKSPMSLKPSSSGDLSKIKASAEMKRNMLRSGEINKVERLGSISDIYLPKNGRLHRSELTASFQDLARSEERLMINAQAHLISDATNKRINELKSSMAIGLRHSPKKVLAAEMQGMKTLDIPHISIIPAPSPLSDIHYTLGQLHKNGRLAQINKLNFEEAVKAGVQKDDVLFSEDGRYDIAAAYFHFQQSAFLGGIEACLLLAHVHSPNQTIFENQGDMTSDERKIAFLQIAAAKGCKEACYWCAIYFETAEESGKALKYFTMLVDEGIKWVAIDKSELYGWEGNGNTWEIKGSLAKIYAEGYEGDEDGNDVVEVNCEKAADLYNEAAEEATAAGKGKLAMKYFEAIEYLEY